VVALHSETNGLDAWYRLTKNKILDEKFGPLGH
jgi:hypothetical protein